MSHPNKKDNMVNNSSQLSNPIGYKTSYNQNQVNINPSTNDFIEEAINEELLCIIKFVVDYFKGIEKKHVPLSNEKKLIEGLNKVYIKYHEKLI